ncbi:UNVERIFIED_CONTAM: hypothetical protein GTU68_030391 [Idotea baltica]|nr:hypothetical protein [Idotea baltica]
MDIAKSISEGLARNVLSAEVNGEVWDATRPITDDADIKLFTWKDDAGKSTFWHSSAHLFAEALESLYPGTKFGIGPSIEAGFYYDVDLGDDVTLTPEDLPAIEKKLPLRIGEFGTVYRYEQSGELHGLSRVRGFTQDDAHLFCTKEQVKGEFLSVLALTKQVLEKMGFEKYTAQISLRDPEKPEKYIGSKENWDSAEKAIIEAVAEVEMETTTVLGEAAFYGPKLDFMVRDALGRSWQLGTIQVDYNLPERFELEYIGADNKPHRPVMIHRAPFGSMERFMSILIEHTAGKFPLWLTPDQFVIIPVSDVFLPYCEELKEKLAVHDIRGFIDERNETIGRKIRDNELQKIPFLLIIGENEVEDNSIGVRIQGEGDKGSMKFDEFVEYFKNLL